MMYRKILILVLFLISSGAYGQSYTYQGKKFNPYLDRFSMTWGVGLSAYQGELSTFLNPKLQRYYLNPSLGYGMSYRYNDYLSVKGEINLFFLYSDAIPKYDSENRIFWSFNLDYYLAPVIDFLPQKKIDGLFSKWNGYVFGGIGQVIFFPQDNKGGGSKTGEILGTEGQSSTYEYARLSVIYPVGGGAKYFIDKNHYISIEALYRFTRTDFIDAFKDLNHGAFDKYLSLQFKYTIILESNPGHYINYEKYLKLRKDRSLR